MSSDTDNKKSTPKDGEKEKSEILDKSTDSNSKDADEVKNNAKDEDVKEKGKIHTEIVDENDPLKDDLDGSKDDEKDPLSNTEDDNNEGSVEDPGSGDEKFDTSEEKNSVESDSNEAENSKVSPKSGEGSGTPLSEITKIDAAISRSKVDDLKPLYKILFNTAGKATIIKRDIKKFSGFDFAKDSNEYKKKVATVEKIEIKQLKTVCDILELEKKGNKEEIASRICEFLVEPHDTEKPNAASGTTGRPRRSAAVKAKNRGYSSHEDYSEEETLTTSRRPQRARKGKRVNLKDESSSNESDDDKGSVYSANDDVSSEEEIPRVVVARGRGRKGKATPAKSSSRRSAASKRNSDSEDDVDESEEEEEEEEDSDFSDEPKSKKARTNSKPAVNNKSKPTPKKAPAKPTPAPAAKNSVKTPAKKAPEPVTEAANARGGRGRRAAATAAVAKVREASSDEENEKEKASSSEDEPLVKKSKTQPPTDEEIKLYVKEILDGANLEEITMKTVCKQVYAHYPDFDLAHKKDFIKTTVKSLIST